MDYSLRLCVFARKKKHKSSRRRMKRKKTLFGANPGSPKNCFA
jgi:hypothetical protein